MTIRAMIVDDERLARRALRQLLVKHEDVTVVAECADAIDAAAVLGGRQVDAVFLDIRMPAVSGLRFAEGLGPGPVVVFVTAYEEHGVAAFDAGGADYLLKPVTAARLATTLARVRTRLTEAEAARLARREGKGGLAERGLHRLVVRVGERDVVVPLDDVELLVADDVHIAVYARGKRYVMRTTLDRLEDQLDPERFARVHRSYLVPVDAVVGMRRGESGQTILELRNGAAVPVSRRRKNALASLYRRAQRG